MCVWLKCKHRRIPTMNILFAISVNFSQYVSVPVLPPFFTHTISVFFVFFSIYTGTPKIAHINTSRNTKCGGPSPIEPFILFFLFFQSNNHCAKYAWQCRALCHRWPIEFGDFALFTLFMQQLCFPAFAASSLLFHSVASFYRIGAAVFFSMFVFLSAWRW